VTPHPFVLSLLARLRVLAALALAAATAYILLDRNHAEEVGGGSRVLAEIVRGERPLSTPTWLALVGLFAVLAVGGRRRARVPVRVSRGR
jgi:hypothetical protein